MTKKSYVPMFVVILMLASLIVGCAGGPGATTSDKVKVFGAFATPIEEPWDGVIHDALLIAKEEGKIEYTYTEDIGYSGDMERVLREVAEQQKPDIIMGDAFVNEEAVRRVAADYPDIAFAFGSELGPVAPNLAVFDNWIHEPTYLCGMIAGGMTKTNKIGVVAAVPIPEVNRLVNAFIAGAKEVNPEVTVMVSFINSFFDPATAKEQALAHISRPVKMRFTVAGQYLDGGTQPRHGIHQGLFDPSANRCGLAQRPTRWHMHVQIDKTALARLAGDDVIKTDRFKRK